MSGLLHHLIDLLTVDVDTTIAIVHHYLSRKGR